MQKPILIGILASAIISLTAICHAENNSANHAEATVYTDTKPNITVTSNQPEFIIRLKSNPTTGYSWFLREYNHELITPVKHMFEKPTSGLVGAGGYEVWKFRVKSDAFHVPEQTTIRLIYARPWEGADNSTQVVFRISIQGSNE